MVKKLKEKMHTLLEVRKENKGFTLVELIVVIVILAILVGVTIGGIYGYVNKSRINTDINNASALQSALAPITTMKDVTVSGSVTAAGTKTTELTAKTEFTGVAGDWGKLGLNYTGSSVNKVKEMFPDGISALKTSGAKYKITYTYDKTGHVTSVNVVAAVGDNALEAQE